jgi:hypothetical protein
MIPPPSPGWIERATGVFFLHADVRRTPISVLPETTQVPPKTLSVEDDDHVIQALASDGADDQFDIGTLPWRARR